MAKWSPTYSPVIAEPDAVAIANYAMAKGMTAEQAAVELFNLREEAIARAEQDPIRFAYVPPIWRVVWALQGMPWVDRDWARDMRRHLTFPAPVRTVLVLGGNRSSKTQFELFTVMHALLEFPKMAGWMFHSTHQQSVEYHQKPMYSLLPIELRPEKPIRGRTAYLSWTQQMGFSNSKFVLPERQECSFRNYSQDRTDAIEGGEIKIFGADEMIPADWLETLELRLATQNGWGIVGFTPVDGYSQTVRLFCEGAETVKSVTAFLLPRDGGPALEHAALGLSEAEYQEVLSAKVERRRCGAPPCRPQDCGAWLTGGTGEPAVPEGRTFEQMPRVLRCKDPQRAVVFFVSSDNPFGNAPNVVDLCRPKGSAWTRTRFYGFAEKTVDVAFPTFKRAVHVIPGKDVPKFGTRYQVVDPCSGRNFFMLWILATPDAHFVYREWPGSYHIPGIGVPDEWAVPSTNARHLDGERGGGQKTFGWGLIEYKREIARLEGWRAFEEWEKGEGSTSNIQRPTSNIQRGTGNAQVGRMTDEEVVAGWNQFGVTREGIEARYMDARFANVRSFEDGGMVTLLEKFDEIGLTFFDTSQNAGGWTIREGVQLITDALWFNPERPVGLGNQPKLFVSEECRNLIFAMENWTGEDGGEGACKDPIDCLRYYFLKGCGHVERGGDAEAAGAARGCY